MVVSFGSSRYISNIRQLKIQAYRRVGFNRYFVAVQDLNVLKDIVKITAYLKPFNLPKAEFSFNLLPPTFLDSCPLLPF